MPETQDMKHYLAELINLYSEQLNQPIASTFGELIKETRRECIQELDKIKQTDMEATLWAKSKSIKALLSQSASHSTNWI